VPDQAFRSQGQSGSCIDSFLSPTRCLRSRCCPPRSVVICAGQSNRLLARSDLPTDAEIGSVLLALTVLSC
jgi:hypothetical protein